MDLTCKHPAPVERTLSDGSKVHDCLDCGQPLVEAYGKLMTINDAIAEDDKRHGN